MTIGPLRWFGPAMAVGGIVTVLDRLVGAGVDPVGTVVLSLVAIVLVVSGALLFRSGIELVDDEVVVVNGLRRHHIPRTQVFDVRHAARWFGYPVEVVTADGRRIPALGCAALSWREAPSRAASKRAEWPYRDVAAAVLHWAVTGRMPLSAPRDRGSASPPERDVHPGS